MRTIQNVPVWYQGQEVNANRLQVVSVFDDLNTFANLTYRLTVATQSVDENGDPIQDDYTYVDVANGTLTISGQDYIDWGNNSDINLAAYQFVADKLNIILV